MSTRLRQAWLKALALAGKESFVARSGLGHPFVCHVGDFFGENPFYNAGALVPELRLAQAWLQQERRPVAIDVGANVGFWSTQLAQMIRAAEPRIYAFEPVPATYCRLARSIELLDLPSMIQPVAAAVSDSEAIVTLSVNPRASGFAQVGSGNLNTRAGDRFAYAASVTLDRFVDSIGKAPSLVKIDVEGSEIAVLKGAARTLSGASRPAVSFELNPITLAESRGDRASIGALLRDYDFHYIDDFEGQRRPFASPVEDLAAIQWVCNIFGVPRSPGSAERFGKAAAEASARLQGVPA